MIEFIKNLNASSTDKPYTYISIITFSLPCCGIDL